jgi:alpha-galactosidase
MKPLKIVILGAGSASFALNSLATLLREPALRGSTLALVDVDPDALRLVRRLAERLNLEWNARFTIEVHGDRCAVLEDADFVVCAIERVPREKLWRHDWEVPLRHGLRQPLAENGGPGGFAHAARNIPPVIDIARDMERLCPDAVLIMLSNPLPRLCRAVTKYTSIQVVGLCHQLSFGYALAGVLLFDRTGVPVPPGILLPNIPLFPYGRAFWATVGEYVTRVSEAIDIQAAGLNHFTWMLDVRDKRTGQDLYPLLRRRFLAVPGGRERLSRDLLRITGYMPATGDTHLSEYLPYTHNPGTRPWERYHLRPYDWARAERGRGELWRELTGTIEGSSTELRRLRDLSSEGICEVVLGLSGRGDVCRPAANVPNHGAIPSLPPDTIVEVPVRFTRAGALPARITELPPMISELCRREAQLVEYVVDAAVQGSRELALQALCLDPTMDDLDVARAVLDDYLEIHRDHLPQFHGKWSNERPCSRPTPLRAAGRGSDRELSAAGTHGPA